MTSADVRARLTHALRLDLIGPEPREPQATEVLPITPSRWYLTGFLVPWNAPDRQKRDEDDTQGELEFAEAGAAGEDDDTTPEPKAARRSHFPSSMGMSVLVPAEAQTLVVHVSWGDYKAFDQAGVPNAEWRRTPRAETVEVALRGSGQLAPVGIPNSDGLEIVVAVRDVHGLEELRDMPVGTRAVSVFLVNKRDALAAIDDRRDERSVFQTQLKVECDRPLVPRVNPRGTAGHDPDERIADLQYRDVLEFAVGHGTSVRSIVDAGECRRVDTTWMPEFEVERVEPAHIDGLELGMETLAELPDLTAAHTSLDGLVEQYRSWIDAQARTTQVEGHRKDVAETLLKSARRAATRIEAGIALLSDPVALEAFKLANRSMAMAARQRRAVEQGTEPAKVGAPQWRPFQLAFVLMNLPAFVDAAHADRELVDLLFFPTGGGKTEAYLGLSAFAILIRRLREPGLESAGVTVLMRYTLRLLTLDQLSRASTLMCALELLRKERLTQLGEWPFEIGLWVGKAATPNRMGRKGDNDRSSARQKTIDHQNNSAKNPTPIPLENCPWCGEKFKPHSFQLKPDANNPAELRIACASPRCAFRGNTSLPIITVDEPLFRRLPCFVISTVDKFANLPWVGQCGALLGGADRYDSSGFYGASEPRMGSPLKHPLPPPDLVIQDELHLISGPLGTMAGLYETAIDALATTERDGVRIRPKVVASTATVRRATDQIRALFARSGVEIFPPPGPNRRTSFFAETRSLERQAGRLYVGFGAQGRSLKVALLKTYLALLAAAQKAWLEAGGDKNKDNPADPYMTLVGYFGSLRELGGSRRIVEDEVASRVSDYGRQRRLNEDEGVFANRPDVREVAELTSRESTSRVSDTKRRLALPFSDQERVDVALATNMISVGLDITRLGLMVVLGQPKAAAEYIQASSRVGRDPGKPGLVVTLMNVHRPRDRSHLERFEAFHAAFYRAVEATSVTPFSARAIDRALPAVTVALARHSHRPLAPAKAAIEMATERPHVTGVADTLAARVRAHRGMSVEEEQRATAGIRSRTTDLLDSWFKVARKQREGGAAARLVYQPYEGADGPPLLRMPLDPELGKLDKDAKKFKAPRSLRDVEASVNLWVKTLDNVMLDSPEEGN